MSFLDNTSIIELEEQARVALRALEEHYGKNPFSCIIEKGSDKYLKLRSCTSLTAGGLRRGDLYKIKCDDQDFMHQEANQCLSSLVKKGWHKFDVDQKLLIDLRRHIAKNSSQEHDISKDSYFQQLSLRLVPAFVYKNIQLYLGSKKVWIYPRQLLRSKPMKLRNLSSKQKSDFAFKFHRDIESTTHVKVFVTLSDSSDGAHEFIQASHLTADRSLGKGFWERAASQETKNFDHEFFAESIYESFLFGGRYEQSSLYSLYPKQDILRMPTFLGSAWVEDSYGLHRGTPCSDTNRCILSITIGAHPVSV